jgi:hypothetical protein
MRAFGYLWAFPVTLIGLVPALSARMTGGSMRVRCGVIEAWGGSAGWLLRGGRIFDGAAAMAIGHVILARDAECLNWSRGHELAHVRQYERWGIFFLPAYWAICIWLKMRGYHPYLDHPLEPPPH